MAIEHVILTLGGLAAADLRTKQYRAVVLGSDNTWNLPLTAITAKSIGILQNTPNLGEECVVAVAGISKAHAAEAMANGIIVAPEWKDDVGDSGKLQVCVTTQFPLGEVVFPSGAEDDLCSVLIGSRHKALAEDLP